MFVSSVSIIDLTFFSSSALVSRMWRRLVEARLQRTRHCASTKAISFLLWVVAAKARRSAWYCVCVRVHVCGCVCCM
jgi:hypothetical protein